MTDNWLPIVSPLLQQRYVEHFRSEREGTPLALPKRRTRKRKPFPGLYEIEDDSEG